MNPTIESWSADPLDVGPLYPFTGWEPMMFAACAAFCVGFLIWKLRTESVMYAAKARKLRQPNALNRALTTSSAKDDPTDGADLHQE